MEPDTPPASPISLMPRAEPVGEGVLRANCKPLFPFASLCAPQQTSIFLSSRPPTETARTAQPGSGSSDESSRTQSELSLLTLPRGHRLVQSAEAQLHVSSYDGVKQAPAASNTFDTDSRDMFLCQMQHGGGMGWPMATRGFILSRYKLGAKTTGLQSQLSSEAAICWSQPPSHLELPRFMPPPPLY